MPRGFDVDETFARSFGIFFPKPGQKSVLVRFRATAEEAAYLRDLPLHHSQAEEGVPDDGGRVTFKLRVIPDKNLVMEFCRLGDRVEVLEPEDLRRAVADELEKASKQYR